MAPVLSANRPPSAESATINWDLSQAIGRGSGRKHEMATGNPFLFPNDLLTSTGATNGQSCEWWLIHTKPRQEKKLAEEMKSRGVPHYLPTTHCKSITRGRSRYTWLPLFPGYMFLKCTSEQRLMALQTNRIVAAHPVFDSQVLVRQLSTLADLIRVGVPLRIEERLVAGSEVQVKAGLLKGKRGIVMKRGGKTRLFVMVAELLGGVSLEIEQHYLEPF